MLKGRESCLLGLVVHHSLGGPLNLNYSCSNDPHPGAHVGASRNRGSARAAGVTAPFDCSGDPDGAEGTVDWP